MPLRKNSDDAGSGGGDDALSGRVAAHRAERRQPGNPSSVRPAAALVLSDARCLERDISPVAGR